MRTIVVELQHSGNRWSETMRINDAEIRAYDIQAEAIVEYVRQHPSPLARLFIPAPTYRVIVRDEQEVARFTLDTPPSTTEHTG